LFNSRENTLYYLQQTQGGVPSSSHRQMVTEMDPDAPIRQNKPLVDLDKEDENRLFKYLFAFLRAGQLDEVGDQSGFLQV
jgi:nuclear pore complex protein Nup107